MIISEDNKLFVKNFSYLTLVQIGNVLIPLLVIPFVARNITQENFGALEFARYFCFFFSLLIQYSFDITTTREVIKYRRDKTKLNNILMQNLYARALLFIAATLIVVPLVELVDAFEQYRELIYLTYFINVGFVMLPMFFFQGMEDLAKISIITLAVRVITGLMIIFIIQDNSLYWVYNAMQSLAFIIIGFIGLYLIFRKYRFRVIAVNFSYIKKLLQEGITVFLSGLVMFLFGAFYYYFLQIYTDQNELGIFSTANKVIVSLNGLMLMPFSQAFFPLINKTYYEKQEKFKRMLRNVFLAIVIWGILGGLLLFFIAGFVIKIAFGQEYLASVTSLQVMAFIPLFAMLNNFVGYQILLTLKKDKLFFILNSFLCLFTILIAYLLRDSMDSVIASMLRLVSEICLFILMGLFAFLALKKPLQHA
ncbi:MAG: oligosaccharide flippase family protein [Weeksellaceae bacterium]|nr:oligosaccharide flippase family protein [Weeksellaceae bacterium]